MKVDAILKWAVDPMQKLINDFEQGMHYTDMICVGVQTLAADEFVNLIEPKRTDEESLFSSKKLDIYIENAKKEQANSYNTVIENAIITQYAYLEAGIKHLIISIFLHEPSLFDEVAISKIKISFVDYMKKNEEERADYFFKQYEDSFRDEYGYKRFEKLLKPVGLDGPIDEKIRVALYEQAQIRNLLLHKNGIADEDFIKRCSHLNYSIGQRVKIPLERFREYASADIRYCAEILGRINARYIHPLL